MAISRVKGGTRAAMGLLLGLREERNRRGETGGGYSTLLSGPSSGLSSSSSLVLKTSSADLSLAGPSSVAGASAAGSAPLPAGATAGAARLGMRRSAIDFLASLRVANATRPLR